jgi:hypothetical protein
MKTIIHVNQNELRKNTKNKTENPVLTCKTYKTNDYANEVEILDKNGEVVAKGSVQPPQAT